MTPEEENALKTMNEHISRTGALLLGATTIYRDNAREHPELCGRPVAYYNIVRFIGYNVGLAQEMLEQIPHAEDEELEDLLEEIDSLVDEAHLAANGLKLTLAEDMDVPYHYACLAAATVSSLWSLTGYSFRLSDAVRVYHEKPVVNHES